MHEFDPRWARNWRRMEAMARRGFRNIEGAMRFADWGSGVGDGVRMGKMLASGDLRLVALYLIEQQPRHGYDLIKAIEEKSEGAYSPSPGIVYPALTWLEEAGFVTSSQDGNKKLYTITDEGRRHLDANRDEIEGILGFLGRTGEWMRNWKRSMEDAFSFRRQEGWGPRGGPEEPATGQAADRDMPGVVPDVNEARKILKKAIKRAVQRGEAEQRRVADILRRAADEIGRSDEDDIDL
jgi:DNA-binding PadR family transcriptional regulator